MRPSILRVVLPAALVSSALFQVACTGTPAVQEAENPRAHGRHATTNPAAGNGVRAPGEPSLVEIRQATERFRDLSVALAEGYLDPMGMCVTAEMEGRPAEEGAMGVHYIRPDLLGITSPPNPRVTGDGTHTDFLNPAILIYEPQRDGSMELVAVENLVFIDAWARAGNREPPTFYGIPWERMEDDPSTEFDEAHGFDPHYDKHIWLYRPNPLGVFSPMNPDVTCRYYGAAG